MSELFLLGQSLNFCLQLVGICRVFPIVSGSVKSSQQNGLNNSEGNGTAKGQSQTKKRRRKIAKKRKRVAKPASDLEGHREKKKKGKRKRRIGQEEDTEENAEKGQRKKRKKKTQDRADPENCGDIFAPNSESESATGELIEIVKRTYHFKTNRYKWKARRGGKSDLDNDYFC